MPFKPLVKKGPEEINLGAPIYLTALFQLTTLLMKLAQLLRQNAS
jgi:hypothetical protein